MDDLVIPLLAMPSFAPLSVDEDDDGAAAPNPTNTLLIAVGKGVVKNLWFRKPDGLQLAIDSDDLLIGKLPIAAFRPGWIAFPHTNATEPCIHDLDAGEKTVALVHGEEFPGLTATWSSDASGVSVTNSPSVSATVYGTFGKNETRSISYRVEHPDVLNSDPVFEFTQTMRFCPQLGETEDVSQGNRYEDPQDEALYNCMCTDGQPCTCCSGEWCHCPFYGCPCNAERDFFYASSPQCENKKA